MLLELDPGNQYVLLIAYPSQESCFDDLEEASYTAQFERFSIFKKHIGYLNF